jgi:hypothetical protein
MPSTETDRWKKNPPKELLNTYPSGQFKKAGHSTLNTMISDSVWDPMNMQTSGAGRVAGGLNDSVGFMHTQSTAKAAQQQALDEDTLDAWNKGRQAIMQCARNRRALQSMPFETEEPDHWASTYQRSHLNFLPATTQDAADHAFKAELPTRVYKRPMNDDLAAMMSMHGPQPTNHGLSFRERDAAMKDIASLKANLKDAQSRNVFLSKNGTNVQEEGRQLNQTLQRSPGTGYVKALDTTSSTTYGHHDRSFYRDPEQLPVLEMTDEEAAYVRSQMERPRHDGIYHTTNSDTYQDRLAMAEIDTSHRKTHHLDKKAGTRQMPRHEPTRSANNHQNTQRAADICPSQYTTTKMFDNQHFREFS